MGPMDLYFDVRDIFRAPRLALSGKKIWIFMIGNLAGFTLYWIFSYLSLALAGMSFGDALNQYGLYPCLYGNEAGWVAWVTYFIGLDAWIITIYLASTAVSRVTLKQLKGNDFFSAGDAWAYVQKHWHPIVFAPISIVLIIAFFLVFSGIFALMGKIPYLGEFLFAVPYLFYFFGSVFTIYTLFVLIISLHYTPAIVGAYEEDTMGTVFQSYSITWSQPWRVIGYHLVLIPLIEISVILFSWFWVAGYGLINYVFGCNWFMGAKLSGMVNYATSLVYPDWLCSFIAGCSGCLTACLTACFSGCLSFFNCSIPAASGTLSGSETVASVLLAISIFLVGLSVLSYGLSIISVGETLMFIIFKKKSDDDDLLQRKDEDELEEDDDDFSFDEDSDDLSDDSNENDDEPDVTNSGEPLDPEKEE
ncbi:MAG TPA: hypothetical protein EYO16_08400 [Candidatus Marinimicrobia bacterium]|nr:hypothetical protein [Candidatus Neomarinimicrobiota bacterium]